VRKRVSIPSGMKIGSLTVICDGPIEVDSRNKKRSTTWCVCNCGNLKKVISYNLTKSKSITKTCGRCNEKYKRGTPTYSSWSAMKSRCNNKNATGYKNYGGRGITVCDRWDLYENFYKDMGERPTGTTLDKIDNNGNYYKDNCRWATQKEQTNNRRTCRFITARGKTQTVSQWGEELHINSSTIIERLNRGWSEERSLEEVIK